MEYTIKLNEQQVEVLKSILVHIEPMALNYTQSPEPKKLTKTQQGLKDLREYRAAHKRKTNKK